MQQYWQLAYKQNSWSSLEIVPQYCYSRVGQQKHCYPACYKTVDLNITLDDWIILV